jgi:hypothetical protein
VAVNTLAALLRKLLSFRSLPWRDRLLAAEAALLLLAAGLTLRLVPYRWFKHWLVLGRPGAPSDPFLVPRVRRAVRIASRNLPFDPACLPQAMAAKFMLALRGSSSSLVVGAGRDGATMTLHAWLESGDTIVTGSGGRSSVTPVVTFSRTFRS